MWPIVAANKWRSCRRPSCAAPTAFRIIAALPWLSRRKGFDLLGLSLDDVDEALGRRRSYIAVSPFSRDERIYLLQQQVDGLGFDVSTSTAMIVANDVPLTDVPILLRETFLAVGGHEHGPRTVHLKNPEWY